MSQNNIRKSNEDIDKTENLSSADSGLPHKTDNNCTQSIANALKEAEKERVKRRKVGVHSRVFKTASKLANSSRIGLSDNVEVHVVSSGSEEDEVEIISSKHERLVTNDSKSSLGHTFESVESQNTNEFSSKKREIESKATGSSTSQNTSSASFKNLLKSPIRLFSDLSEIDEDKRLRSNVDTVSLIDLIGAPDLSETYQFNFSVSLPVFLSFLDEKFIQRYRKIVFITGSTVFESPEMRDTIKKKFNISEAAAPLPNQFASHHTKMMVNFFENDEAEIVISTSNFMQIDICGLTQAVWKSGRLTKGTSTTTQGKRFRMDLLRYLGRYGLSVTKKLIALLGKYDFSSVDVELVASAPGTYELDSINPSGEYYGYAKLRQVLERNNLLVKDTNMQHNILSQVTSIAYPYTSQKGNTSSVFSHLLCPLMFENWRKDLSPGSQSFEHHQQQFNYKSHIVFPTIENIAQSTLGYMSGVAVHFKYEASSIHKAQYEQNIRRYLCKWTTSGTITGRENVTPHVKYYACDNGDNWKSLKWVMVGSHNLSKQAWGYPKASSKGREMIVSSYELSVLIPSKPVEILVPIYGKDSGESVNAKFVRFPFVLPPTPYDENDRPWSADSSCGSLKDRWGNTFP